MKWHKISEELPPENILLTIRRTNIHSYKKEFLAKLCKDHAGRYIWNLPDNATPELVLTTDEWPETEPPELD